MTKQADLTLKEVCQGLGKSKRTITRYIKKRILNPERIKNEKGILEYKLDPFIDIVFLECYFKFK